MYHLSFDATGVLFLFDSIGSFVCAREHRMEERPLIDRISALCQSYLRELTQCEGARHLYRGERTSSIFELRECPTDRTPRDTRPVYHRAADEWFLRQFGTRYRTESLFCTGSQETAASYAKGQVRFIYPVGEFKVCWSPRVHDMFMWTFNRDVAEFISFLEDDAAYREGDLCSALSSGSEIMVDCEAFFSLATPLDQLPGVLPGH